MASDNLRWESLASVFPASLDTDTDAAKLKDGFTPLAHGMGLDKPGVLYKELSTPTKDSYPAKSYTISATAWTLYYRRLWRIADANLYWTAREYTTVALTQGLGILGFDDDAEALITFFPFANDSMFVCKSTGGYAVKNADGAQGRFIGSAIEPAMGTTDSTFATRLDNVAYVSNPRGLFAWDGREVVEVTAKLRNASAAYKSAILQIDRQRRRIVGGTTMGTDMFVFDPKTNGYFDYSTAGFKWTSKAVVAPSGEPYAIKAIAFRYELDSTNNEDQSVTCRHYCDGTWTDETKYVLGMQDTRGMWQSFHIDDLPMARRFQTQITAMTDGVRIREVFIQAGARAYPEGYSR